MSEPGEAALMTQVDADPRVHEATEGDEEAVLRDLYGEADADGIHRGDGA